MCTYIHAWSPVCGNESFRSCGQVRQMRQRKVSGPQTCGLTNRRNRKPARSRMCCNRIWMAMAVLHDPEATGARAKVLAEVLAEIGWWWHEYDSRFSVKIFRADFHDSLVEPSPRFPDPKVCKVICTFGSVLHKYFGEMALKKKWYSQSKAL